MSQPTVRPAMLRLALLACAALLVGAAAACESPSNSPRPSPSLLDLEFTPLPTTTGRASPAPGQSEDPTPANRPLGWDVAFCELVTDAVVAQELLVDIERAMDEEEIRDARLLAHELTLISTHAAELALGVPPWAPANDALSQLTLLMNLDAQAAAEYTTYFDNERRRVLRRARAARDQVAGEIPSVNEELQGLTDLGVSCPGVTLELESP